MAFFSECVHVLSNLYSGRPLSAVVCALVFFLEQPAPASSQASVSQTGGAWTNEYGQTSSSVGTAAVAAAAAAPLAASSAGWMQGGSRQLSYGISGHDTAGAEMDGAISQKVRQTTGKRGAL